MTKRHIEKDNTKACDIAVIGAGAAGTMAAIRASQLGKCVVLLERNSTLGKKIMITGNGRCNITNASPIDTFIKKFNPGGEFLRSAFFSFSNKDLMSFFQSKGLELKFEEQGKVFPVTDKARSVISVLQDCLKENGVDIVYDTRVTDIEREKDCFILVSESSACVKTKKVIVATGGASYKETGSTGDGFTIAGRLGHTIIPLSPGLVPLKTKERWVKELQGIALDSVRITFFYGDKKINSDKGQVIFTHFGISGPLVLDMSGDIVSAIAKYKEVRMEVDLKPDLKKEELERKLVDKFAAQGNIQIKNLMQDILPKRMAGIFLSLLNITPEKPANQITKAERRTILDTLKGLTLTITDSLSMDEAMVTRGGVSRKEINPRTMESRLVPGLYFAGEVIEGAAPSGGYNLQQAFSTGYLAGEKAAVNHKILSIEPYAKR